MGVSYPKSVTADTSVVTTNETAAITSEPISTPREGSQVTITGDVNITTGTATTAVTIRCRRGSGVGGTVVGETKPHTIGAAASGNLSFHFVDTPGDVAGQTYTITVVQTAATGNGTINNASVTVSTNLP